MSILGLLCLLFALIAALMLVLYGLQRRELSGFSELSQQLQRIAIGGRLPGRVELDSDRPELAAANPDALVLLSVRDPDKWYRSCINTIFGGMQVMVDEGNEWMAAMLRLFAERFSDKIDDRDAMIDAFERHNDAVRKAIPADRLLEWSAADGWEPICARLGLPVPSEPFPITNTTHEFREMFGMPPVEA